MKKVKLSKNPTVSVKKGAVDSVVRHQIYLQRYAGTNASQILGFVKKLKKELVSSLGDTNTVLSAARYTKQLNSMKVLAKDLTKDLVATQKDELVGLAKYEADFTKRLLDKTTIESTEELLFETVTPSVTQLKTAAFTSVMDKEIGSTLGKTVGDALGDYGKKIAGGMVQEVRTGFALGKTTDEIADGISAIGGSAIRGYEATALARTITNHISAMAREETYAQNADIIESYQIVATLDDVTTEECGARDGDIVDIDGAELPPYHWNCRTTFISVIKEEYRLDIPDGNRPAKGDDGEERVSGKTDYNSWLKSQPASFQDDILGKVKGDLFRNGGMDMKDFVDHNYQPIDLKDLKDKDNAHIFDRHGL